MSMPLPRRQTEVCRCPCPDDKLKFVGLSLPRCIGLRRESNRRECRCPCPDDKLKFVGLSLPRCIGLRRELNGRESYFVIRDFNAKGRVILHLALEDQPRKRRFDFTLYRALQRSRTVDRIVTRVCEMRLCVLGKLERDPALGKPRSQTVELYVHDLLQVFLRQGVEHDRFVNSVQEFRCEMSPQCVEHSFFHSLVLIAFSLSAILENQMASDVAGHDDDRVFEIDDSTLPIGQSAVIEYLKQDIENVVMSLFDFIQQHYRVRPAPHGFGQLAAFLVTNVTRRRADQSRNRMLLLIFGHIDADHRVLIVEQKHRRRARYFVFSYAGRSQEYERADRAIRVLETRPRANNRIGYRAYCFVLTNHAFVQVFFEREQFLKLTLEQLGNRDAGPAADNLRNVLFINFFLEESCSIRLPVEFGFVLTKLFLKLGKLAVLKLGCSIQVILALSLLDRYLCLLDLFSNRANLLDGFLLGGPLSLQLVGVRPVVGEFLLEFLQSSPRCRVGFLLQCFALDLQLHDSTEILVKLAGHRVNFGPELGGGFVYKVDGLVRQKPIRDVSVREHRRRHERRVFDANAVMNLVAFL